MLEVVDQPGEAETGALHRLLVLREERRTQRLGLWVTDEDVIYNTRHLSVTLEKHNRCLEEIQTVPGQCS